MCFFFSSRRRHTRWPRDWSSDVCSSDLEATQKLKDTYEVKQMDYQMKFDKESKYLLELESSRKYSYEMDFHDKTGTMESVEKTVVMYKSHNQVKEIVLPKEVLENAKEQTE